MDETIKNTVEEQQTNIGNEEVETTSSNENKDDELKKAVNEQLEKISRQQLLIGAQTVCSVILQKIASALNQPGKRTMNDYKRIIKDIEKFCQTGVSRKVNVDGEVESIKEKSAEVTNNTKLMEESDESNTNENN